METIILSPDPTFSIYIQNFIGWRRENMVQANLIKPPKKERRKKGMVNFTKCRSKSLHQLSKSHLQ